MLSALILENFKAFGRRQVIPLAPITLIFGANSSGKSSILQSLLLLKQSLRQAAKGEDLLVPKGEYADLGGFSEMVFKHDVARTCEITPLLARQDDLGNQLPRAIWPLGFSLSGPCGVGVRFGFDKATERLKLCHIPCYLGNVQQSAFNLAPVEAPLQHEISADLGGSRLMVRVSDLVESHPCWTEWYDTFMEPMESERLGLLMGFLGMRADEPPSALLNRSRLEIVRDELRALQGHSPELLREGLSWLRVWRDNLTESDASLVPFLDERIRELESGSSEGESVARPVLHAFLGKALQLDNLDMDSLEGFIWESEATHQIWRLVVALHFLELIESNSPDLEDELSALNILHLVDGDALVGDVRLNQVRDLMTHRLLSLRDFSLSRFLSEIQAVNALRTLIVEDFLPGSSPFPKLVDGDLKTALEACFEGETRQSWDLLPNVVEVSRLMSSLLRMELEKLS